MIKQASVAVDSNERTLMISLSMDDLEELRQGKSFTLELTEPDYTCTKLVIHGYEKTASNTSPDEPKAA